MSERYSKVFMLEENLYGEGLPAMIAAGALLKDNQTGKVLAQLKFRNISQKTIKGIFVKIKEKDIAGKQTGITEHQFLDLNAVGGAEFGQQTPIYLSDANTREYEAEITRVFLDGGEEISGEGKRLMPVKKAEILDEKLGEYAAQYRRDVPWAGAYLPEDMGSFWKCTCGAINDKEREFCHNCKLLKQDIFDALDEEGLKNRLNEHNKMLEKQAEERRIAAEEEAKRATEKAAAKKEKLNKLKKKLLIFGPIALVLIAAILIVTFTVFIPNGKYDNAVALLKKNKFKAAENAFSELGNYKDSADMIYECRYQEAFYSLENTETVEKAYSLFKELGSYKDSAEQLEKFKYVETSVISESSDGLSQTEYRYDEKGRVIEVLYYEDKDALPSSKSFYTYQEDGSYIVTYINYDEKKNVESTTISEYDKDDKLLSDVTTWEGNTFEGRTIYTYYPSGKIKSEESINYDLITNETEVLWRRDYDEEGNSETNNFYVLNDPYDIYDGREAIKEIRKVNKFGDDVFIEIYQKDGSIDKTTHEYTYDENGNITTSTSSFSLYDKDGKPIYEYPAIMLTYEYDEKGDLVKSESKTDTSVYEYTYDEFGNKIESAYYHTSKYGNNYSSVDTITYKLIYIG